VAKATAESITDCNVTNNIAFMAFDTTAMSNLVKQGVHSSLNAHISIPHVCLRLLLEKILS